MRENSAPPSRELRVMMLPNASRAGGNPFVGLLVDHLDAGISTRPFSWKTAFTGEYDVFHAHWPEYLLQASSVGGAMLRGVAFASLRPALALRGKPIVVTVHNRLSHSGLGALRERLVLNFRAAAFRRIFLNEFDRHGPDFAPGDVVVRHGDYWASVRGAATELAAIAPEPDRVLLFGGLRANKGIDALLDAFRGISGAGARLSICGRVHDASVLPLLEERAGRDERVHLEIGELDNVELSRRIRRAHLVVLPYPNLYNSGAVFMALTLGRPVFLPDSSTGRELRREFGEARIHLFEGELDSAALDHALRSASAGRSGLPSSLGKLREWQEIGSAYSQVYRDAADGHTRAEGR